MIDLNTHTTETTELTASLWHCSNGQNKQPHKRQRFKINHSSIHVARVFTMLLPDEAREITRIVSDPPPSEKIAAAQRQFEPTVDAIQTMSARDFSNLSETEKSAMVKRQYERTMYAIQAMARLTEFGAKGRPDEAREITRIVSDPPPSEKIAAAQKKFEPTVDAIQTMSVRDFSNLTETEKSAAVKRQYERTTHAIQAMARLAEFGEKGMPDEAREVTEMLAPPPTRSPTREHRKKEENDAENGTREKQEKRRVYNFEKRRWESECPPAPQKKRPRTRDHNKETEELDEPWPWRLWQA